MSRSATVPFLLLVVLLSAAPSIHGAIKRYEVFAHDFDKLSPEQAAHSLRFTGSAEQTTAWKDLARLSHASVVQAQQDGASVAAPSTSEPLKPLDDETIKAIQCASRCDDTCNELNIAFAQWMQNLDKADRIDSRGTYGNATVWDQHQKNSSDKWTSRLVLSSGSVFPCDKASIDTIDKAARALIEEAGSTEQGPYNGVPVPLVERAVVDVLEVAGVPMISAAEARRTACSQMKDAASVELCVTRTQELNNTLSAFIDEVDAMLAWINGTAVGGFDVPASDLVPYPEGYECVERKDGSSRAFVGTYTNPSGVVVGSAEAVCKVQPCSTNMLKTQCRGELEVSVPNYRTMTQEALEAAVTARSAPWKGSLQALKDTIVGWKNAQQWDEVIRKTPIPSKIAKCKLPTPTKA